MNPEPYFLDGAWTIGCVYRCGHKKLREASNRADAVLIRDKCAVYDCPRCAYDAVADKVNREAST